MTEDRFDVTLRLLERAERPDPAFAEALYSQLAAQAGFGGARGGLRRVGARWPTFVAQLRPAWLVLLVGLLMLLVTGFALLGGGGQPVGLLGSRTEAPSQRPEPSESPFRLGSDVLKVGEVAPAWSGSLLDGTPFSTGDLLGQPAALFLWCSCAPGPYASRFLDEAASRSGEMALVLVSLDELGTTQGLVDWLGVRTPVAYDDDATGGLLRTWRLNGFPALVLLRPDGSVADIRSGVFSAGGLAAALDALAAGAPIPSPEPLPTPRSEAVSSVLVEGSPPRSCADRYWVAATSRPATCWGSRPWSCIGSRRTPRATRWTMPPEPKHCSPRRRHARGR